MFNEMLVTSAYFSHEMLSFINGTVLASKQNERSQLYFPSHLCNTMTFFHFCKYKTFTNWAKKWSLFPIGSTSSMNLKKN
jgi:hypothetical protein